MTLALPAQAQKTRREVRLTIEDCSPSAVEPRDAYAAAALELDLVESRGAAGTSTSDVELDATLVCEKGVKARLTLRTAESSAERSITLDDANVKDRPRVLALALAELVRAEWRWVTTGKGDESDVPAGDERRSGAAAKTKEEDAPKAPVSASDAATTPASKAVVATRARPTDADAVDVDEPSAERGLELEGLGRMRAVFAGPTLLYGASLGARFRRWSFGVEGLFGRAESELGTTNLGFADGRVGLEVLRLVRGRFWLSAEPGLSLGATWLAGVPVSSSVEVANATRLFADARLALRAELRFATLSPTLSLEAGRATGFAATEEGHTIGRTGGWFVGVALGATLGGTQL